ncbi:hypothetical protein MBLNU459_g6525t1 [Dothideomycetes sp. NU459]
MDEPLATEKRLASKSLLEQQLLQSRAQTKKYERAISIYERMEKEEREHREREAAFQKKKERDTEALRMLGLLESNEKTSLPTGGQTLQILPGNAFELTIQEPAPLLLTTPVATPKDLMSISKPVQTNAFPFNEQSGEPSLSHYEVGNHLSRATHIILSRSGWIELRCCECGGNHNKGGGRAGQGFAAGWWGMYLHLQLTHAVRMSKSQVMTKCKHRDVSEEEVKQILTGKLEKPLQIIYYRKDARLMRVGKKRASHKAPRRLKRMVKTDSEDDDEEYNYK